MESVSTGKYDGRSVNWSHPMNNSTHLPPKSPHGSFSMFSSASLFEAPGGLTLPPPTQHRRSPSAGCIPPQLGPLQQQQQQQQPWLFDRLESPDVILKKCSHRRSSSDSVAFVDHSYQYLNYLENVTEEEEVILQEPPLSAFRPAHHRRGVSADHSSSFQSFQYNNNPPATQRSYPEKATRGDHNINREQFSRFRTTEPFQRPQRRHENVVAAAAFNRVAMAKPGYQETLGKAKKHVTLSTPPNNSKSESSGTASRGGGGGGGGGRAPAAVHAHWSSNISSTAVPTFENRSTASESNSHSDDSNDDVRAKSYERFEVRSEEGGDGPVQAHEGCTSSDQVDPKKAKRIQANRQSAQRSRVRKLQYISELEMNVNLLETEVASLSPKVGYFDHERVVLSKENAMLKQKLATLAKSQLLKEAYNEKLMTELQRLRQICSQQSQAQAHYSPPQQQQMLQHIQRPVSPDSLELQLLRFSKMDLGLPMIPKPKSPTAFKWPSSSGRSVAVSHNNLSALYKP